MKASAIAEQINKKLGGDAVVLGSRLLEEGPVSFLSTGSLATDVAYGGGFIRNQWNEIVGLESSGKTAMVLKTIAHNQKVNPDFMTFWLAAEDLEPEWCVQLGVDLDRLVVGTTNAMEEAYDMCLHVIDNQLGDIVVIDSLPALSPMKEIEDDMEGYTVGRGALLTGQFLRKARTAMKTFGRERSTTCIMINQWRDRIGVTRGDPRTTPGGKAKNYVFWSRVELSRISWIERSGEKVGITSKLRTFKNKAAPVGREAELDFYFAEGGPVGVGEFDTMKEVIAVALAFEVIERRGAQYDFLGENLAKGRDQLAEVIREDQALYEKIYRTTLDRAQGTEAPPEPPQALRRGVKRRA